MNIYIVPEYLTEEELRNRGICPEATVEAEYGDRVIKGKRITLAHHTKDYAHCPAPCNDERAQKLKNEEAQIVCSHLDLDTLGGCLALMGNKPEDGAFWQAAEYMDCHGIHHMYKFSEKIQNQLNAWYAYEQTALSRRYEDITEVTEEAERSRDILERILSGDEELIQQGICWAQKATDRVEKKLIYEDEKLRVFRTADQTFCAAQYYSPKYGRAAEATLTYNETKGSIMLAFEDGGQRYSARDIVRELWGELAGGHPGIAGSPRGVYMDEKEFGRIREKVKEIFANE